MNDIEFVDELMCEVSGIYPSMIGTLEGSSRTATEINTKTQGQMTRLSMMLDVINQYFVLPTVRKIAKLSADFKQGQETVFLNHEDKQETITIDDEVRQADYKYTYSDRSMIGEKSMTADMLVQAVEKFAQFIPLNVQEIFTWYFEQKGVENPERFLGVANQSTGVEGNENVVPDLSGNVEENAFQPMLPPNIQNDGSNQIQENLVPQQEELQKHPLTDFAMVLVHILDSLKSKKDIKEKNNV